MGRRVVLLASVGLSAFVLAGGAGASGDGWKPASGTLFAFAVPESTESQGVNTLITFTGGGTFSGTFSGPATVDSGSTWLIHPDGSSSIHASGSVTGAIGDCGVIPGGVQYRSVYFLQAQPDGSITFTAHATALGPQGANYDIDLSGVVPPGELSATETYTGRYRCN